MEQIVKVPSQNMSSYLFHYLPNEDQTVGGDKNLTKKSATTSFMAATQSAQPNPTTVITAELLDVVLYGKRKVQEIDIEEAKRQKTAKEIYQRENESDTRGPVWCEKCQSYHGPEAVCSTPPNILRQIMGNTVHDIQLTYAVLSFPPEVQLCTSTIPGYNYGVCAKQPFPVGTWIGPYEGKRLQPEEVTMKGDSSYVWEIYQDGNFSHFLDGNDENTSSWMRFIRCARHKGEQNMVVFQYGDNIYYRAVRDIPPGVELLVWYNNNYTQFLGVPLGLRNVPGTKKDQSPTTPTNQTTKAEESSPLSQDEFKAFLREQINKSQEKAKVAVYSQPNSHATSFSSQRNGTGNVVIPQPAHGLPNSTPQPIYGPPIIPQPFPGSPINIPQAPTIAMNTVPPQSSYGTANNTLKAIPEVVGATVPQVINGAYVNPIPQAMHGPVSYISQPVKYPTQFQTNSTYCYNGANPTQTPMMYVNRNSVQPTVTINYRPTTTQTTSANISPTTSVPDNIQRQQYLQASHSNDTPNTNYTMLPTSEQHQITTAASMIQENRISPGDQKVSMKCNQCQQTFDQQSLFEMHMCYKSPDKPFECGHCSEAYATTSELRNHVMSHTNDRPFKCGFCGSSFSGSSTLNTHMQTHNVERSFRCQKCGRTFSMATQLSRHMRTPGDCPSVGNSSQHQSDAATPFTSTLTRG